MELTGSQQIRRDRAGVWAALNDPAVLQQCIPGCESMARDGDNGYAVAMTAAVGPVKARFNGKLALSDIRPEEGYALSFEGSGGAAGFGKGGAVVTLAPQDEGTLLVYRAQAKVGGKLAQVGARLIDGVAAKMAADFFERFKALVEQPTPEAEPAAEAPTRNVRGEGSRTSRRLAMLIAAVLAGAVVWYLLRSR